MQSLSLHNHEVLMVAFAIAVFASRKENQRPPWEPFRTYHSPENRQSSDLHSPYTARAVYVDPQSLPIFDITTISHIERLMPGSFCLP